ncbi:hypothetical protein SAMN02927895_05296 [Belnapia rosea]|nr:hypothetical protein SAMN02927895_05296 [Belnapia rosea]
MDHAVSLGAAGLDLRQAVGDADQAIEAGYSRSVAAPATRKFRIRQARR